MAQAGRVHHDRHRRAEARQTRDIDTREGGAGGTTGDQVGPKRHEIGQQTLFEGARPGGPDHGDRLGHAPLYPMRQRALRAIRIYRSSSVT